MESEGFIQALACFVIFIDIQHRLFDALFLEVDQTFCTDSLTDSFSGFGWINTDYIELTDGILVHKVAVNLGPTETSNLLVVNAEEETCGIKPRFVHAVFKIGHRPITLIGMLGKDQIV